MLHPYYALGNALMGTFSSAPCEFPKAVEDSECPICMREYCKQEDEDTRPPCLPIQFRCGHVFGSTCFSEHFARTGDELCAYCRQKVVTRQYIYNSVYATVLRYILNSSWFHWQEAHLNIDSESPGLHLALFQLDAKRRKSILYGLPVTAQDAFREWTAQAGKTLLWQVLFPGAISLFVFVYGVWEPESVPKSDRYGEVPSNLSRSLGVFWFWISALSPIVQSSGFLDYLCRSVPSEGWLVALFLSYEMMLSAPVVAENTRFEGPVFWSLNFPAMVPAEKAAFRLEFAFASWALSGRALACSFGT
ncbi:hypothetical protein BDV96DRAFT_606253 [Lophiotrema nucula]|uniref:RING-type domain-containing protein n=1 Tax=Lophiotrema nucula TaxID=690887 RepID=A0A6A5YKR8_9PLEO|nr:hypothetical protein BDV96DRAFT_606253 [Lophiotrema nucula]